MAPSAVIAAAAQDPRGGTWTLVSAQSSLEPPDRLSIAAVHDGLHVTMTGETHLDFTANKNGKQSAAPGNLGFDQIELHTIDKRSAEVKEEKDEAVVGSVREQVSKDGKELTVTTAARGQADKVTVWNRTGGAKAAGDPFAGDWTEDLSKTRMRQGLVLKIEADGNGGVRFQGEYSYSAHLDGKPYDVKNSRNDSVSLALADPHTVDATYRRDNQVSQKDRWVVSADGHQMTLTSTGTLETGQHVTEMLQFRKQ